MKYCGITLLLLITLLGGCSSEPSIPSPSPSPEQAQKDKKVAKADNKAAQKGKAKKPGKAQNSKPSEASTLEEAEVAAKAERYREASTIARNTLDRLRSDEAPRMEIVKTMESLAGYQVKAEMFEKAYANYTELAKAEPSNTTYSQALKTTRQLYWDKVLDPKLEEAKRLSGKNRHTAAIAIAEEVRSAALKVELNPEPADKLLAVLSKAQAAHGTQRPIAAKPQVVAQASVPKQQPVKKAVAKPKKPIKTQTVEEDANAYPTSGGARKR